MGIMSEILANKLLNAIFRNEGLQNENVNLSLHTNSPGDDGSNEVTAGENTYTRKETEAADWDAADDKVIKTAATADFEWEDMPGVTVTHIGVWSAISVGDFLWGGALTASKTVPAGETLRFKGGEIVAEIDPEET